MSALSDVTNEAPRTIRIKNVSSHSSVPLDVPPETSFS